MSKYPPFLEKNIKLGLNKELLKIMPRELILEFDAFVFEKDSDSGLVKIAAVNPENIALRHYAKEKFGDKVEWFSAQKEDVDFILKNLKRDFKNDILFLANNVTENNENITKIVDGIIEYALAQKASDIHIEPSRNEFLVRFRIDGAMHQMLNLPRSIYQALVARIKIIANLRIDEYRRPQDGRIEPENFPDISLRTSIIPTLFGEKIAMRILDDSQKDILIEELGFSKEQKNIILQNIEKPFGMIVASGPTGSGKTTTLYALLQIFKKDGFNISTLEDPIEYVLHGVNQIQINLQVGLTFPIGLRSLLRQDPDIMMVGEIRDTETASMAADAAMTGHIVFTTLHTNDAASAFTRFLEMGVDDFVVSSTINLVIAQRLVRKICNNCAEKKMLDKITIKKIKERKDIMEALQEKQIGSLNKFEEMTFRQGRGCDLCFQTGYLGRIGIFELLTPNKEIHDLILSHKSSEAIRAAAEKNGFRDMITDGIDKVFLGITTFEEVLRVTKNI
ncbi:MAG: Type II secretion system protein E [Parcubacteria group bacterium Athens0714_24]|nr:MAG: Type II secretion system protein E [Parcubacteria group bacterium Athens0714_24]